MIVKWYFFLFIDTKRLP